MSALAIISACLLAFALLYWLVIRPWQLRWGATDKEVALDLPGDELVTQPHFIATRGISIKATPDAIWKWIIQIGSMRAGWYSIDWIDNGGRESARQIVPEYQQIAVGQFIPFTPDQKHGMWVKAFKEHDFILWADKDGNATWLWYIYQKKNGSSRLLTRLRTRYIWKGFWIFYYLLFDLGDIVMMRRCLKGIKERAEQAGSTGALSENRQDHWQP